MSGSSSAVVMYNAGALGIFFLGALAFGLVFFSLGEKIEERARKQEIVEIAG